MPWKSPVISCMSRMMQALTALCLMCCYVTALGDDFSDWNQTTGIKHIEYRWKANEAKGCELEYRNLDERDKKKYKTRIAFQGEGEEHVRPYAVVSFSDGRTASDSVTGCKVVTDVSVTRF